MKYLKILFIIMSISPAAICQNEPLELGKVVEIITQFGSKVSGEIIELDDDKVVLRTKSMREIKIKRNHIKLSFFHDKSKFKKIELDKNGRPIDFHNSTHYYLTPSAYGLKKGQAYYENIWLFGHSYSCGVTDKLSFTVGGELVSLLNKQFPSLFISTKYSLPLKSEKLAFSIGSFLYTTPRAGYSDPFAFSAVLNAAITIGGRNTNFTFGMGLGFDFQYGIGESILPFYASGMIRITPNVSLVTENILFTSFEIDDFKLGPVFSSSVSIRYHFEKNGAALNVGFLAFYGFRLPIFSATIPIGK